MSKVCSKGDTNIGNDQLQSFLTDVTMRSSSWDNAQQRLRRRLAREDASHFDLHHFQHHFLILAFLGRTTSDVPMLRISLDEV